MKNRIYIIAFLVVGLTSCTKLLDVEPHTFSSDANYYENEGQILRAVNGAYGSLQEIYTGDSFWALTEMRSDNTNYQFDESDRGAQQREEIDEFLISSSNNYVNASWQLLYRNIQQTNVIIDRIEPVVFASEEVKARYIGEAKFLRALQYFYLVRLFGAVPLLVKEVASPEEAFSKGRASVEEVYAQIILDAEDAVAKLPATHDATSIGRATKGAALTLLGEVHLTLKDYNSAISNLEQVVAMNYALVPKYGDNFNPGTKNNSESIFSIQFNSGIQTEAGNFIFMFGPRNGKLPLTGYSGTLGGSNIPTPSLVNAYEAGDLRKEESIQMFSDASNINFEESKAFNGMIPFIKKYYHPPFTEDGRANENWPVYRYSHVLLMLAEATNELGTGDPYKYINPVRQRANLAPLSGLVQSAFRDAVLKEQRIELAFENHRWFQLLRTGKAAEIMNQHGTEEKQRLSRLSNASYNVQPHKLLFPIPEREIRLNGFAQNPGW